MGLTSATALVIGSIIGTGVFTMPAVLAGAGTSHRHTSSDATTPEQGR
jgi:amino acid transporter